jgi:hypothetical protein
MRRAILLLALSGCDALFGIDHVALAPDAAPDAPAPRVTVTGHADRAYLHDSATHEPILEPVPYTTSPITVRLADGTMAPVDWTEASASFTFEVGEGETYAAILLNAVEYHSTARSVSLRQVVLGRTDQVAPQAGAALDLMYAPQSATDPIAISTTGIWSHTGVLGGGTSTRIVWSNASWNQSPAVPSAAAHDSVYLLEYAGDPQTTPVQTHIAKYARLDVEQPPNSSVALSAAMQTPPSDCVQPAWTIGSELAELAGRYGAAGFGSPAGGVQVLSVPRADEGLYVSYPLSFLQSTTNGSATMPYGNPFIGHDAMVLSNAFLSRSTNGTMLSANVVHWDKLATDGGCPAHANTDDTPPFVMLPPRLAGVAIEDGVRIGIPKDARYVELSWDLDPSTPTFTQIGLSTETNVIRSFGTVDRRIRIDPAILDNNVRYYLSFVVTTAYRNAASGDFVTIGYPYTSTIVMTGFFTVSKN